MSVTQIHKGKTPVRRHYVREWAAKYGVKKAEIARQTGADKSLVGKWINDGVLPGEPYLAQLAVLFDTTPEALFRLPEEDWIARFFKERLQNIEERERAVTLLETAFPKAEKAS